MGKKRPLKKFAQVKKMVSASDPRRKSVQEREAKREEEAKEAQVKQVQQTASSLFFKYNTALAPPYSILVDTNFFNFSIKNKLDLIKASMDCLYAEVKILVTDCVMAELEKMGSKYRVALRIARDPRFERMPCQHKGTYADDCLVQRCTQNRVYIVATCDRGLKQRLRKIPGVPIMYISGRKYNIEQLPEAYGVMF